MEVVFSKNSAHTKNFLSIGRRGSTSEQYITQNIVMGEGGDILAEWAITLGSQPQKGQARWLPYEPGALFVLAAGSNETKIALSPGTILWPPEADEKMRRAAQEMAPIQLSTFTFPFSALSRLELVPNLAEPVGIFSDAVRYSGTFSEGGSTSQVTCWISPADGQIKQFSSQSGLIIITQREELPPPVDSGGVGLFEWTLCRLPHMPFVAWREEVIVKGLPDIAEGPQQQRIGPGEYRLSRAAPPYGEDNRQLPVKGKASADPEEAPYLADSPLLGIQDSVITELAARLRIDPNATRWEVCCRVNAFVFDLIRDKGLDVGFATAPEVAADPRGDCTEHTVLTIALLRRLGVPARAVFGWAGLDDGAETTMGLHAWVEAKTGRRWIPLDPTFDQAPAGAFRAAISVSALNSYAELGWGLGMMPIAAPNSLVASAKPISFLESGLVIDGITITLEKGRWATGGGRLFADLPQAGQIAVNGNVRHLSTADSKLIHFPGHAPARYEKSASRLAIDCGKNRWLYFEGLSEVAAMEVLKAVKLSEEPAAVESPLDVQKK
ncbi:MAG: transglutaminase family protein [Holophagaceae bacterium]|nr:transglutaminase family protein [Holophagaceae bacterium]